MIEQLFPYIGEHILERIIREDPSHILRQLNLLPSDFLGIESNLPVVFPASKVMFDGKSRIDLGLLLGDGSLVPIEVKLGHTGLIRSDINNKLSPCSISRHPTERRIRGNMLAVLNRYFEPALDGLISDDLLHARVNGQLFAVRREWGIVARERVLKSWSDFPPSFNSYQVTFSLEEICRAYGRDKFNELVESMLSGVDYFEKWGLNKDHDRR